MAPPSERMGTVTSRTETNVSDRPHFLCTWNRMHLYEKTHNKHYCDVIDANEDITISAAQGRAGQCQPSDSAVYVEMDTISHYLAKHQTEIDECIQSHSIQTRFTDYRRECWRWTARRMRSRPAQARRRSGYKGTPRAACAGAALRPPPAGPQESNINSMHNFSESAINRREYSARPSVRTDANVSRKSAASRPAVRLTLGPCQCGFYVHAIRRKIGIWCAM
ncbi:unnamed protein product [Spodoptera exigua]|nr:unnamed protein product [Spodoptera exigua]